MEPERANGAANGAANGGVSDGVTGFALAGGVSPGYVVVWARTCAAIRRYDGSAAAVRRCRAAIAQLTILMRIDAYAPDAIRRFVASMVRTGVRDDAAMAPLEPMALACVDVVCARVDGEVEALDGGRR